MMVWVRWPLARFVVADASMRPALEPGDRLIVWRWARAFRVGEVVVARDPQQPERFLLKRVAGALGSRAWILLGDNRAVSRDSRAFGPVRRELLVGRAIWRYLPGQRRGRVR